MRQRTAILLHFAFLLQAIGRCRVLPISRAHKLFFIRYFDFFPHIFH